MGVETPAEAREHENKAEAVAQYNLGVMYDNGEGVPQDDIQAVKWFRKAADQGVDRAQFILSLIYEQGLGVPQDYVLAHMWSNLAAARGSELGRKKRDILAKQMTPADVSKAQRLAREWLEKHGE